MRGEDFTEKKNAGFLFATAKVASITAMIFFRINN